MEIEKERLVAFFSLLDEWSKAHNALCSTPEDLHTSSASSSLDHSTAPSPEKDTPDR